jgi:DNA adenine methylase
MIEEYEPFLRWAGGKRWLARKISHTIRALLETSKGRYIEPFLGAGAMFFSVAPKRSILSDTNWELINSFWQVREEPEYLLWRLRRMPVTRDEYYLTRQGSPRSERARAARFIYLNRTCYGGLYRTNLKGEFNVPYGGGSRTPAVLWRDGILERAAHLLGNTKCVLRCGDFEEHLRRAREGDIVYCDPTYGGATRGAFDRYGATIFGWPDQQRLRRAAQFAMDRGVVVLISNSASDALTRLYATAHQIMLRRSKAIGNRALNEISHHEMLAIFDPWRRDDIWSDFDHGEDRRSLCHLELEQVMAGQSRGVQTSLGRRANVGQ